MTPTQMTNAFYQWWEAHEAVHGPLSGEERQFAFEIVDFLVTCAQVGAGTLEDPAHAAP